MDTKELPNRGIVDKITEGNKVLEKEKSYIEKENDDLKKAIDDLKKERDDLKKERNDLQRNLSQDEYMRQITLNEERITLKEKQILVNKELIALKEQRITKNKEQIRNIINEQTTGEYC